MSIMVMDNLVSNECNLVFKGAFDKYGVPSWNIYGCSKVS